MLVCTFTLASSFFVDLVRVLSMLFLYRQKVVFVVNAALFVLFIFLLVQIYSLISFSSSLNLELPEFSKSNMESRAVLDVNGLSISIFGRVSDEPEIKPDVESEPKDTTLNMKLLGVLSMPESGVAIIGLRDGSKSYLIGDFIQKGVQLKEVHPRYVVIQNRGVAEKLLMEEEDLFSAVDSK